MTVYSPVQVYSLARSRGYSPADALAVAGISATESGGDSGAIQPNGQGRGLIQIDLGQHPDVTEAQALDPVFSLDWLKANGGPHGVTFYGPKNHPDVYQNAIKSVMAANPEAKAAGSGGSIWQGIASDLMKLAGNVDPSVAGSGPSVSDATGGITGIYDAVKVLPAAAAWIAKPHNWLRVIEVALGAVLVLAGMWRLSPGMTGPATSTAKKAAGLVAVA